MARDLVVKLATPPATATVASAAPPSRKVTVPVGVTPVTVAVSVTGRPNMMLVAEAVSITVVVALVIAKLCVTGVAAAKLTLPGCVATIEHWPTASSDTLDPATLQVAGVEEAKATTRLELAVADTVNAPEPIARSVRAAKVIVLVPGVMLKLCTTGVAAAKLALPGCEAVIEQEPAATKVIALPATVQVAVVVDV